MLVQVALVAASAVPRNEYFLIQHAQGLQGPQPLVGVCFLDVGLHLVENVVAGENHALFLDKDGGLVKGVAWHVNHLEGVVTDVQGHAVAKGYDRSVRRVVLQQGRLVRTHTGHPGNVLFQVGIQDPLTDTLVSDDRHVEVGIAGPVVAVGFGVDDVEQFAVFGDFLLELQGIAGLLGAVDHYNAFRRYHETMVATPNLGFREYAAANLFHLVSPFEFYIQAYLRSPRRVCISA